MRRNCSSTFSTSPALRRRWPRRFAPAWRACALRGPDFLPFTSNCRAHPITPPAPDSRRAGAGFSGCRHCRQTGARQRARGRVARPARDRARHRIAGGWRSSAFAGSAHGTGQFAALANRQSRGLLPASSGRRPATRCVDAAAGRNRYPAAQHPRSVRNATSPAHRQGARGDGAGDAAPARDRSVSRAGDGHAADHDLSARQAFTGRDFCGRTGLLGRALEEGCDAA